MNPAGYRLLLADRVPLGVLSLFRARPAFPWLLPWALPAEEGSARLWPVATGYADAARAAAERDAVEPTPTPFQLPTGLYEASRARAGESVGKLSLGWVGKRLFYTDWQGAILWTPIFGGARSPLSPEVTLTYTRIPGYSPSL